MSFSSLPSFYVCLSLALCMGLTACGDNNDNNDNDGNTPETPDAPEIVGVWASNFGSIESITENTFGGATIVAVDNDANFLVTQNAADAEFFPGRFSKVVWTTPQADEFYYCTVTFDEPTLEAARDTPKTADEDGVDTDGCGGFSWTKLTDKEQAIATFGTWKTSFGGTQGDDETITTIKWGATDIRAYDNTNRWAVTQNAADAEFGPSTYNRLVWTPIEDGVFHYCTVAFSLETEQAALDSEATADTDALDTDGCGGFPWTKMNAQ